MRQRYSTRLQGRAYAQEGAYYITICTSRRANLLGKIVDGQMVLSALGHIARREWLLTPYVRPEACLDAFVVLPDHIHAIVVIMQCADVRTASVFRSPSHTLSKIVRGFKSAVTRKANSMGMTSGLGMWQRNYYEHIVRDEADLDRIRRYIAANTSH